MSASELEADNVIDTNLYVGPNGSTVCTSVKKPKSRVFPDIREFSYKCLTDFHWLGEDSVQIASGAFSNSALLALSILTEIPSHCVRMSESQ